MPRGKRWNPNRRTAKEEVTKNYYNQPAYMLEIGDREGGGPLLVNGMEVHRRGYGCQTQVDLDMLVERAAENRLL